MATGGGGLERMGRGRNTEGTGKGQAWNGEEKNGVARGGGEEE